MAIVELHDSVSIDELPSFDKELALTWTLSLDEIRFISQSAKGDQQALYFSAMLTSLRNNGDFINTEDGLSDQIIHFLCSQLGIMPITLTLASKNSQTTYKQKIKEYLKYRDFDANQAKNLKSYILAELQKDLFSTQALTIKAIDYLKHHKMMRPSPSVLERTIASYRQEAITLLYDKIANKLTMEQKEKMLKVLLKQPNLASQANYYKKSPPEPTATRINLFMKRFNELQDLGITNIRFSDVSEAVFNQCELLGRTYDANALNQLKPESKKIALLLCMLVSASQSLLDHIADMNDQLLAKKERISKNAYQRELKNINKKAEKGVRFLVKTTKQWWHHNDPSNTSLLDFQKKISTKEMEASLTACDQLNTYQTCGYYEILERKYSDLRKYTTLFFQLDFKGAPGTENLLKAIQMLKKLNQENSNTLPKDAPIYFIPKVWQKAINKDGKLSRRTWEMALYYEVKNQIDKGDIYLEQSKKHQYFWSAIYAEDQWQKEKSHSFKTLDFPEKFEDMLVILKKEYLDGIELIKQNLSVDNFAYIDANGELSLRKDDKLILPDSVTKTKKLIESRMEVVRIEKLLSDLDNQYQLSKFFTSPEGFEQKIAFDLQNLYAAIIALGTNLGFVDMAKSMLGNASLEKIKHVAQWCIRPEIITETNNFFIQKHSEHPLSKLYGDFTWSGSDGDRFCIQKSTNLSSLYPKNFGYHQKVVTIYTHLSDQYSVFKTQVISCGEREASYVLSGLLNNLMIGSSHVHCTDTGGFTHQLFALCYLLGFSFQPRLKDLADQKLYKLFKEDHYGKVNCLFKSTIDLNCISEQWEQFIRIAISLKNQVAPANLIVQKLAARSGSDRVAKAIMELGKLIKTIYIMHYISNPELRRKVQLQLNRGESRHYLARHIFFANQGELKTSDYEEMMNIASCLSLLSNAVLLWNTPRIYAIVQDLRQSGMEIDDEDLKRISPLMFRHIIVHGAYDFRALALGYALGVNYASN